MFMMRAIVPIFCLVFGLGIQVACAQTAENYALSGTASQYDTGYRGVASRAIDGNTDGTYRNGSVQHSGNARVGNWWQVDLGEIKDIGSVKLWNRTDCCEARATDFHVFVSDVPFTDNGVGVAGIAATQAQAGVSDFHDTGTMGRPTEFVINRTGRYVRVQLVSQQQLHMAEVEVFGLLPEPKLSISKTPDKTSAVRAGEVITYLYTVKNTGNVVIHDVVLTDDHMGFGIRPVPVWKRIVEDVAPSGDTIFTNGVLETIGPGDTVEFSAIYTVTQDDIDQLQ